MEGGLKLCPNCNLIPLINIIDRKVHINCNCNYKKVLNVIEYLNIINNNKTTTPLDCNSPLYISTKQKINEGHKHLNNYFTSLKDSMLNQLQNKINAIKSAYEESFEINSNLLSLLTILIDNFDGSLVMEKNIIDNSKIYPTECDSTDDLNKVLIYYKTFSILNGKQFNPKSLKNIKLIEGHKSSVNSLLLLKDSRIASCSYDGSIRIFDPSNNYLCDQLIKRHSDGVTSICQIDNGTIVSSSVDLSIFIGDYCIKNAHEYTIYKVISIPNNRIVSCSMDNTIKIWKSNPPYSNIPIKVLEGHESGVRSLLYIKEKDIMISGANDNTLRMWNMSTYTCDNMINGVNCSGTNALYQIDENTIIVGEYQKFTIVNISRCVIENICQNKTLYYVNCFLKLTDNLILCGCDNGIFYLYNKNTNKGKIIKDDDENKKINDLLPLNDETFISCSGNCPLRVWSSWCFVLN